MKKILGIAVALLTVSAFGKGLGTLPEWQEGMLDIHCISTGVGNSIFFVLPDGTTMLEDAGELTPRSDRQKDYGKGAGRRIADYIKSFHPAGQDAELDYAFISHFHYDHIGHPGSRIYGPGNYPLSGITEVGTLVPIHKFLDRGFTWPVDIDSCTDEKIAGFRQWIQFYRTFIEYQKTQGMQYEEIRVGSSDQISLVRNPEGYPDFRIRILFSGGKIADPEKDTVAYCKSVEGEYPEENDLSAGFRLDYGPFRFYSGGDIAGIGHTGGMDPESMECAVADLVGPVDVAVLNHHGDRNSQNEKFVATLSPRVWLGLSWGVRHPGQETVRRISSRYIYPEERDIYATWMSEHCRAYLSKLLSDYKSFSGHIVVRVAPGGESYDIYVLDDRNTRRDVIMHNHYTSRGGNSLKDNAVGEKD